MPRNCHAFARKIWCFALPPNSTSSLSLKFCIYTSTYHLYVLGKFQNKRSSWSGEIWEDILYFCLSGVTKTQNCASRTQIFESLSEIFETVNVKHKYIFCEIFKILRQVEGKIICSFKLLNKHWLGHFRPALIRLQENFQHYWNLWQQGETSFVITANTVICPLPSCMPDITITKYYFPT